MAPVIKARYSFVGYTSADPSVSVTAPVVAGDVLLLFATWGSAGYAGTSVSGLGATWTKVANTLTTVSEVWIGRGATGTGLVTYAAVGDVNGRTLNLVHVGGTTGTVVGANSSPGTATPTSSPVLSAGNGQLVFGTAYTVDSSGGISGLSPSAGWTQEPTQTNTTQRYWAQISRIPTSTSSHSFTATYYMQEVVLGDRNPIDSQLSGSGALTSTLVHRTNLIPNPSFESGTKYGWNGAVNSGSTAIDTTTSVFGTRSLTAAATGSGLRVRGSNGSSQVSEMSPVVPGKTYTLSAWVKPNVVIDVSIYAFGANSTGTATAVYPSSTASVSSGGWTRLSTTFTVAAGSADRYIYPNLEVPSSLSGVTLSIDGVMLQEGSLGPYFDGDTPAAGGYTYAWTGTPGQSASVENFSTASSGKAISSALSGSGTLGSRLAYTKRIASSLSGSGTLGSSLAYTKRISSALSGSGTLAAALRRNIASSLSGSGSLTSVLSNNKIVSALSGSGTLTSGLHRYIKSSLSGSGTLASRLSGYQNIASALSGSGALTSRLTGYRRISSALSGEGVLSSVVATRNGINSRFYGYGALVSKLKYSPRFTSVLEGAEGVLHSDLEYVIQPQPLADLPLGKLVRYTVNNYAVPLNPAEGSGSTPSVNATYIKGKNPEFALGEDFTVDNAAVGRYTGEIVRLSVNKKSDVATISTDTMLTKTNVEKHLYPFIDTDPGTWTAARAIDYWTQQCGAFYDNVDGEVSVYASGYGHTNGYALGIADSHFYDKVTAGSVSSTVVNGRTVTSFGSAATTVMAQHEADETRVPINLASNRRMVFSFGVGVRGTGRTASVTYNFIDASEHTHAVRIEVTSDGLVTSKVGGAVTHTLQAPGTGNYRVSFSIQRASATAMVGKLTIHADDLDGEGTLLANSPSKAFTSTLPATLWLMSVDHASAGGSGAEMLRWGTYLSVAKFHPMTLPAVQKELGQSAKPLAYVSGFSGNVWKMLNEFCSINRLDVSFLGDRMVLGPRANGFSGSVKFSDFTADMERREKYKQVAVVNKRSKAVTTGDAVFWRADSVFQVAAREVFETTVQTGHSILNLSQPQAVTGIMPFPYKQGTGQYVVTGADGYIVSPQWWYDNGGKVEVKMTETEGEIAIKITAPQIDTVRAPYRISEGAGDRPALYVSGSGIMNDPTELHIASGAKNAREGFDNVFESPFIATTADAYNTAARMAMAYNAAMADVSFEVANDFGVPSDLGTYPAGTVFTDNERNYKITDAAQTHNKTTGSAIPYTSIAAYNASYPEGTTIREAQVRHAGRTIKEVNIKPLRSNDA